MHLENSRYSCWCQRKLIVLDKWKQWFFLYRDINFIFFNRRPKSLFVCSLGKITYIFQILPWASSAWVIFPVWWLIKLFCMSKLTDNFLVLTFNWSNFANPPVFAWFLFQAAVINAAEYVQLFGILLYCGKCHQVNRLHKFHSFSQLVHSLHTCGMHLLDNSHQIHL